MGLAKLVALKCRVADAVKRGENCDALFESREEVEEESEAEDVEHHHSRPTLKIAQAFRA